MVSEVIPGRGMKKEFASGKSAFLLD